MSTIDSSILSMYTTTTISAREPCIVIMVSTDDVGGPTSPYCQGKGTVQPTLLRHTLKMNLSCIFKCMPLTYIFLVFCCLAAEGPPNQSEACLTPGSPVISLRLLFEITQSNTSFPLPAPYCISEYKTFKTHSIAKHQSFPSHSTTKPFHYKSSAKSKMSSACLILVV